MVSLRESERLQNVHGLLVFKTRMMRFIVGILALVVTGSILSNELHGDLKTDFFHCRCYTHQV